jgi:hypothetical protein
VQVALILNLNHIVGLIVSPERFAPFNVLYVPVNPVPVSISYSYKKLSVPVPVRVGAIFASAVCHNI